MKLNFEVATTNKNEKVIPLEEQALEKNYKTIIENEVIKYLQSTKNRNEKNASETLKMVQNGNKIDNRLLRVPEASFQNSLLRLVYHHDIPLENISHWIKSSIAKHKSSNSLEIQEQIDSILRGVESCLEAVNTLEEKSKIEYKNENTWIATNDNLDALYKIDLLNGIEDKEGLIKILKLIQVKSKIEKVDTKQITETHQEYLNLLPQLINKLNKKDAKSIINEDFEIVDIDRRQEKEDQLTLFNLVLDEYIKNTKELNKISAVVLFELFRKEGGIFNPFTMVGILNNEQMMHKFCPNKQIRKKLSETADRIPFTEEESLAFYKKYHIKTILDSAKIISVIMEKDKIISEIELKHPYQKTKE